MSETKKTFTNNIIYLALLQMSNYVLPVISIPIIVSHIGIANYGMYSVVVSVVILARIALNYGFDWSATKEVSSINSNSHTSNTSLSILYSSIIFLKLIILLIVYAIVFIGALSKLIESDLAILLIIGLFTLVSDIFFPNWLFHGHSDMQVVTIARVISKVIGFIILYFTLVAYGTIIYVLIVDCIVSIMLSCLGIYFTKSKYDVKIVSTSVDHLKIVLYEATPIFVSNVFVQTYTTINTLVLGYVAGASAVGIYSISEKVYSAGRGLLNPFVQGVYPILSNEYANNSIKYSKKVTAITYFYIIISIIVSLIIFACADSAASLLLKQSDANAELLIKILALSISFSLGTLFSPLYVIELRKRSLLTVTMTVSIFSIVTVYPVVFFYGAIGLVMLTFVAQILQAYLHIYIYWNGSMN